MPERIRRGQRAALYALLAASWLLTASVGPARADPERTAVAQLTPSLLSDEAYTEGWDYYFYFPDGAWITVQLFVSNFGPGDHRALLIAKISEPGSEALVIKNGRSRGEWSFSPDPYRFTLARHRFEGRFPDYVIELRNSAGELDLSLHAEAPPQADMVTGSKPDRRQTTAFVFPRLSVQGQYRPRDKTRSQPFPWRDLGRGSGFAVRYVNRGEMTDVARQWVRFAPLDGPPGTLPLLFSVVQEEDVSATYTVIKRADGRESMLASVLAGVPEPDELEDSAVPGPIQVVGEGPAGRVIGRIVPLRRIDRFNFVDELKRLERLFLRLMNTPLQYRYLAEYEFDLPGDESRPKLSGIGIIEFMKLD